MANIQYIRSREPKKAGREEMTSDLLKLHARWNRPYAEKLEKYNFLLAIAREKIKAAKKEGRNLAPLKELKKLDYSSPESKFLALDPSEVAAYLDSLTYSNLKKVWRCMNDGQAEFYITNLDSKIVELSYFNRCGDKQRSEFGILPDSRSGRGRHQRGGSRNGDD